MMKMMMQDTHVSHIPSTNLMTKPTEAPAQLNSQGEVIQPSEGSTISQPTSNAPSQQLVESSYEGISLSDTPLAIPQDAFYPATDDTGLVHAIISCGHVLKSTHDLARWSEKTGARRVNSEESIDSISDLVLSLDAPRKAASNNNNGNGNGPRNNGKYGSARRNKQWSLKASNQQPSQVIACGPVLKSTHDMATWSEKRGSNAVNSADASGVLDDLALNQGSQAGGSRIISCGPVLKSTHDLATWSEKRGANAVNSADASGALDDLAQGGRGAQQAGGNSLQSGLDTQAGSHMQLDGSQGKISETPERAMAELHLHV